ncbi:uncharacterized protein LOC144017325 isoform X3 [Festucalex cinctus]
MTGRTIIFSSRLDYDDSEEDLCPEQQAWCCRMEQQEQEPDPIKEKEDLELLHIKVEEEPEALDIKEEEQEDDITKVLLTGDIVKSEESDADHEEGSQLDSLLAPVSDSDKNITSQSSDADDDEQHSPATSTSSSGGIPRCSQASRETSRVSWVVPGASRRWDMPGTSLQGGVQKAYKPDAQAISTSSSPFRV